MNKQDFLNKLRASLGGMVPADQVEDTIRYYEDYINTQERLGKTESQVLQELGDPRLIARSISDVYKAEHEGKSAAEQKARSTAYRADNNGQSGYGAGGNGWNQQGVAGFAGPNMHGDSVMGKVIRMPGWLIALIVVLIFLLFFVLDFRNLHLVSM